MIVTIKPSTISGDLNAPVSKSSMQRLCAAALLNQGKTIICNAGNSNDDLASMDVVQKLGAQLSRQEGNLVILSGGVDPISNEVNCGESGLGLRMFGPIAALSSKSIILKGEGSLLLRPMNFFDEIFPQLGIKISSNNGKLPINIQGPLTPRNIKVDGSLSSQFLTGLLFAFANSCKEEVQIEVTDLVSRPYIDLTLEVLQMFDYVVINDNYRKFIIRPASHPYRNRTVTAEGDWSGAAFLLVAGAIAGRVSVDGLNLHSTQADRRIVDALEKAKANIVFNNTNLTIEKSKLEAFEFDATNCPDLFPPLVALASYCSGTTRIKGVSRLKHKESNRSIALQMEFNKMGVSIELNADDMIIYGNGNLTGAFVHSHHDHRIAMACAVAALRAEGQTTIVNAECVSKSYPSFFDHLKQLKVALTGEL